MVGAAFIAGGLLIALMVTVFYVFRLVEERDRLNRELAALRGMGLHPLPSGDDEEDEVP